MHQERGFGVIGVLVAIAVLAIVGFVGWHVLHAKPGKTTSSSTTSSQAPTSTAQQTKHGSETTDVDATYEKYTNYDIGLSLTYSKTVASNTCNGGTPPNLSIVEKSTPVKVYEDIADRKLYVAPSQYAQAKRHMLDPGSSQGFDSCVQADMSMDAIQHPLNSQSYLVDVLDVEFDYATISNESELDGFAARYTPTGIVIDHAAAPVKTGNTYAYAFKSTETQGDSPQAKWYYLLYSPTRKLAVFWVTPNTQSPSWQDGDSARGFSLPNPPSATILD